MKLKFVKMQGTGNDYIYIDCLDRQIKGLNELAIRLSDRHFGIGADGLVAICPSDKADVKMKMFNADGSEGKMCGNAVRCIARYLTDKKIVSGNKVTIETLAGVKSVVRKENMFSVNMGKPIFNPDKIPVLIHDEIIINKEIIIKDNKYNVTAVSMGNPHMVIFVDTELKDLDIEKIGRDFQNCNLFPNGINIEFAKVTAFNEIEMRVWERGSGETMACGTGACAVAVAAVLNEYCNRGNQIKVKLVGGDLVIDYSSECVVMTGEAEIVFEGVINVENK